MLEGTFPNDEAEPFSFKGLPELEREKQWYRDCINQVMPKSSEDFHSESGMVFYALKGYIFLKHRHFII